MHRCVRSVRVVAVSDAAGMQFQSKPTEVSVCCDDSDTAAAREDTHIGSIESVGLLVGYLLVDDFACRGGRLMLVCWHTGCARCGRGWKSASRIDGVCDDWSRLFVVVRHGLQRELGRSEEEQEQRVSLLLLFVWLLLWVDLPTFPAALFGQLPPLFFFPLRKRAPGNGGQEDLQARGKRVGKRARTKSKAKRRSRYTLVCAGFACDVACSLLACLRKAPSTHEFLFWSLFQPSGQQRPEREKEKKKKEKRGKKDCSTNKQQPCPSRYRLCRGSAGGFDDEEVVEEEKSKKRERKESVLYVWLCTERRPRKI